MSAGAVLTANQTIASTVSQRDFLYRGSTESTRGNARAWQHHRPLITETSKRDVDQGSADVEFERLSREQTVAHAPESDKAKWALATVLKVEPESITCEVAGLDRYWEISLPPILFPKSVSYGNTLRIGMQIIGGYRTPVIEIINPVVTVDSEIENLRSELEAI